MNPTASPDYIAIDWGTSRRRAYRVDAAGRILARIEDDCGARSVAAGGYPAVLAGLRDALGPLPVIAAGMVGSQLGWQSTPYLSAPVTLAALAGAATRVTAEDCTLTPGVSLDAAEGCDVMRGEEIQALGAAAAGLVPPDALVCQPGTHSKWITLADGRIATFRSVMTGELFALLRGDGSLAMLLDGPVAVGVAFRDGVSAGAAARSLGAALFGTRAAVLLGRLPVGNAAAYASGVLIGAEIAGELGDAAGTVYIIADDRLGALYAEAIGLLGGAAVRVDSHTAFVAGIHALQASL
ncbi:2-dehydro-3-deoxygalactonokinase [Sphingomonas flavalba]|uniref:2-dehydro-3-deoxygalactonokinase n=1 Tax=Sphingomonas flavalba TaxID=2559804 RepID=UPI00109DB087|nr:2-dehydro-3-deoxygalactonokinase [Sphingomonas flavalba]